MKLTAKALLLWTCVAAASVYVKATTSTVIEDTRRLNKSKKIKVAKSKTAKTGKKGKISLTPSTGLEDKIGIATGTGVVDKISPTPATGLVDLNHLTINGEIDDGVWIDVVIGTPGQSVSVLFDTGSSTLGVAPLDLVGNTSVPCYNVAFPQCLEGAPKNSHTCVFGFYNPMNSSTASFLPSSVEPCGTGSSSSNGRCPIYVGYGFGTCAQGFVGDVVASDKLTIGEKSAHVSFVSITTLQKGFQEPPTAGIMGVGLKPGNEHYASFSDQTSRTGGTTTRPDAFGTFLSGAGYDNEFALCMGNQTNPGTLFLGSIDDAAKEKYYTGDLQTVDLLEGSQYYAVELTGVSLGKFPAPASQYKSAIVDSGTSFTILPEDQWNLIKTVSCSSDADCILSIHLTNDVTLTATGLTGCNFARGTCGVEEGRAGGLDVRYGPVFVIGYNVLRNYFTHFDRSGKTISFATGTPQCVF